MSTANWSLLGTSLSSSGPVRSSSLLAAPCVGRSVEKMCVLLPFPFSTSPAHTVVMQTYQFLIDSIKVLANSPLPPPEPLIDQPLSSSSVGGRKAKVASPVTLFSLTDAIKSPAKKQKTVKASTPTAVSSSTNPSSEDMAIDGVAGMSVAEGKKKAGSSSSSSKTRAGGK